MSNEYTANRLAAPECAAALTQVAGAAETYRCLSTDPRDTPLTAPGADLLLRLGLAERSGFGSEGAKIGDGLIISKLGAVLQVDIEAALLRALDI